MGGREHRNLSPLSSIERPQQGASAAAETYGCMIWQKDPQGRTTEHPHPRAVVVLWQVHAAAGEGGSYRRIEMAEWRNEGLIRKMSDPMWGASC